MKTELRTKHDEIRDEIDHSDGLEYLIRHKAGPEHYDLDKLDPELAMHWRRAAESLEFIVKRVGAEEV